MTAEGGYVDARAMAGNHNGEGNVDGGEGKATTTNIRAPAEATEMRFYAVVRGRDVGVFTSPYVALFFCCTRTNRS